MFCSKHSPNTCLRFIQKFWYSHDHAGLRNDRQTAEQTLHSSKYWYIRLYERLLAGRTRPWYTRIQHLDLPTNCEWFMYLVRILRLKYFNISKTTTIIFLILSHPVPNHLIYFCLWLWNLQNQDIAFSFLAINK